MVEMAIGRRPTILLLCTLLATANLVASRDINIGVVTGDGQHLEGSTRLVEDALRNATAGDVNLLPLVEVVAHHDPLVEVVAHHDPLATAAAVCELADEGVAAVIAGSASGSGCGHHGVPCITVHPGAPKHHDSLLLSLTPNKEIIDKAVAELLQEMKWFTLTVVYDTVDNLGLAEPLLADSNFRVNLIKVQSDSKYQKVAGDILSTKGSRVLVALQQHNLHGVLRATQGLNKPLRFLVANTRTNMVGLQEVAAGQNVMAIRLGSEADMHKITAQYSDAQPIESALMMDAVSVISNAVRQRAQHGEDAVQTVQRLCKDKTKWAQGSDIFSTFSQMKFEGASGPVAFDSEGRRTDFLLTVVEVEEQQTKEIIRWSVGEGVQQNDAPLSRKYRDISHLSGGRPPTFRVAAVLKAPYVMLKLQEENDTELFGNERYEGFSVDLMDELANELGFNYILDINEESRYGNIDQETGEWVGMIGDLIDQRIDLIIGDISITPVRESVVDFSDPWYSFGIGLLVHASAPHSSGNWFMFLEVFSWELWIVIIAACTSTALLLFCLARTSPYERVGSPDQEPQNWTPFTLCYSCWFAFTTLFRQFIFFQPRAISTRIFALIWWLVAIVVAAFYIANLASFFTLRGMQSVARINSIYELPDQNQITYSALYGGSTWAFFRDSKSESLQRLYSAMYNGASEGRMMSSSQGVQEVLDREGSFGFLMEEPSLAYITERQCDLKQLGGTVGSRDYAIALQQDSVYLDFFNDALYRIRESGMMQNLRTMWWQERRGGGQCEGGRFLTAASSGVFASVVELDDLAGPLILLAAGAGVAIIIALVECCCWAGSSAGSKGSSMASEFGLQMEQVFTSQPSQHLPLTRQYKP